MAELDNLETYKKYDTGGMLVHLHNLPRQCQEAWQKASEFTLPHEFRNADKIVICGMGGSAIGADLLRSLASDMAKPIIFVSREYDLPAFVDSETLLIASSYSGNTEETLSAFRQALNLDCKKLVSTTDGKLKGLAEEKGIPVFSIEYAAQPRAALGYSFIPLIAFLCHLGFLSDKSAELRKMVTVLDSLVSELAENVATSLNPAKQLAGKLLGKLIVVYGGGILSPVARRWKGQFNENSKSWAFYETFSELNHNAVVGYEFPEELADKIYVVLLRCPSLHPHILARYEVTSEILDKAGIGHEIIDSRGEDRLTQMMSLVFPGDWVSYYLAMLNETDPTPVKMIAYLKERLSQLS
ncbi:MAG: bifunctional phosphoglucose/phosphomannose isomerase [Chloroflexota bacterium]|nr:bifunctional phosphoglucose/phosphomannose isomerase [Chloroflexota bacterium]